MNTDLIVIGGGAGGLMAAGFAASRGLRVTLIEKKERVGRKVLISGKGRCNVTNNCTVEDFLPQVKSGEKFLLSALYSFSPEMTMDFFENLGVPLKTERGNRVFPQSDKSQDIVKALTKFCKNNGVKILTDTAAKEVITEGGKIKGVRIAGGENGNTKPQELFAPNVLIATGGLSYPKTGSTGDGYKFAKALGHTVVPPKSGLIPIELKGDTHKRLQGLSLRNVTLKVIDKNTNKILFSELGEMLFTHFGVSGPLVLKASFYMDDTKMDSYKLEIDLKPALSEEQLDKRILRDFSEFSNKDFQNSLGKLLPKKLIPVVVHKVDVQPTVKVNQFPSKARKDLIKLLKGFTLYPEAFRPVEEAIVTRGGVDLKEINPSTMESKLVKGLYFAGEVLNVDAYTGGYNLQIAFSTANLAANNIELGEKR